MPLYVYSCPECEIELEELRPSGQADWPPVECPICHGLCVREVRSFNVKRSQVPTTAAPGTPPAGRLAYHGPDCRCCTPSKR